MALSLINIEVLKQKFRTDPNAKFYVFDRDDTLMDGQSRPINGPYIETFLKNIDGMFAIASKGLADAYDNDPYLTNLINKKEVNIPFCQEMVLVASGNHGKLQTKFSADVTELARTYYNNLLQNAPENVTEELNQEFLTHDIKVFLGSPEGKGITLKLNANVFSRDSLADGKLMQFIELLYKLELRVGFNVDQVAALKKMGIEEIQFPDDYYLIDKSQLVLIDDDLRVCDHAKVLGFTVVHADNDDVRDLTLKYIQNCKDDLQNDNFKAMIGSIEAVLRKFELTDYDTCFLKKLKVNIVNTMQYYKNLLSHKNKFTIQLEALLVACDSNNVNSEEQLKEIQEKNLEVDADIESLRQALKDDKKEIREGLDRIRDYVTAQYPCNYYIRKINILRVMVKDSLEATLGKIHEITKKISPPKKFSLTKNNQKETSPFHKICRRLNYQIIGERDEAKLSAIIEIAKGALPSTRNPDEALFFHDLIMMEEFLKPKGWITPIEQNIKFNTLLEESQRNYQKIEKPKPKEKPIFECYFTDLHAYFLSKFEAGLTKESEKKSFDERACDFSCLLAMLAKHQNDTPVDFVVAVKQFFEGVGFDSELLADVNEDNNIILSGSPDEPPIVADQFGSRPMKFFGGIVKVNRSSQQYETRRDFLKKLSVAQAPLIQQSFKDYDDFLQTKKDLVIDTKLSKSEAIAIRVAKAVTAPVVPIVIQHNNNNNNNIE